MKKAIIAHNKCLDRIYNYLICKGNFNSTICIKQLAKIKLIEFQFSLKELRVENKYF